MSTLVLTAIYDPELSARQSLIQYIVGRAAVRMYSLGLPVTSSPPYLTTAAECSWIP